MKLEEILSSIKRGKYYSHTDYVEMWKGWYQGYVKNFHEYTIYNGKKTLRRRRFSLSMAKRVCEDWANLLINERTDIVLDNDKSQDTLNEIFEETNFWDKANDAVEKYMALGGGAFVISVEDIPLNAKLQIRKAGKIDINFYDAESVYPITVKKGVITECAFVSFENGKVYLAVHLLENGEYVIHNFEGVGDDINNITINPSESYDFQTGSDLPWFYYIKPKLVNNIDIRSPLGVSVYANAIDVLKSVDLVYDSIQTEFSLGRKRVFINARSTTLGADGEIKDVFDSNDIAFYVLPESDDGKQTIQSDTQPLRIAEHKEGLQLQLNLLSKACGFGQEHYKYDKGGIATATQVISENSEMFRSIRKQEIAIEAVLKGIVKTVIYVANSFTQYRLKPDTDITVKFDDSIIEDKISERDSDRVDVSMGAMSKAEYRAKWYSEDEDTAQKKIDEIDSTSIPDVDIEVTDNDGQSKEVDGSGA